MNNPLVCICIPIYNNEYTIAETLESILNQSYKNIVIKIFENKSIDNTMQVLALFEKKYSTVTVYQNEIHLSPEKNLTKCIEGLEGEFGAIFHADDIYHPEMVETQVKYLSKNDISAVFVRANLIDDNANNIGEQFFPQELKSESYHQFNFKQLFSLILKYDNFLITPSVMARVDIYKNKIKFCNEEAFKKSADLDLWLRFSEIKDVGIITDKLISYRMSIASFSYRTKFSRLVPRDMFLVINYYFDKYNTVKFNTSDYEYLKFKDNIMVITNKILNNLHVNVNELKLFNVEILKIIFFDKQKFKIYIYAGLVKLLLFFNCKKILMKLIKQVNGIKGGD